MRTAIEQALRRTWAHRGVLACVLWPMSLLFSGLMRVRQAAYHFGLLKQHRTSRPVVVIGNVLVGGTGKTPVVMAVVQHFVQLGLKPGVISRGYGRQSRGWRETQLDSAASAVGEEALLIKRHCGVPVYVAEERVRAALALVQAYPDTDVLVSDDGLQHLALGRDIEICLFDERGTGNGWVLPAGPLREPWPRQVDMVLRSADAPDLGGYVVHRSLAPYALACDGTQHPLSSLSASPLAAVTGIAKPDAFFAMLRAQGLTLQQTVAFPDHHSYVDWNRHAFEGCTVVCTEKDAVKLWALDPQVLAVPLVIELDPDFLRELESLLPVALKARLSLAASATAINRETSHGQQAA